MTIKYNVEVPNMKHTTKAGECLIAVKQFLESNKKTMCVEFDDIKSANSNYNSILSYRRRHKHNHYKVIRRKSQLYIIKQ